MSLNIQEINECLKENSITLNTGRFSIQLTCIEAFDPSTLQFVNYTRASENDGDIDCLLENKPKDSKVYLVSDSFVVDQLLFIPMIIDESKAPSLEYSETRTSGFDQMLIFSTTITPKNCNKKFVHEKSGWVWRQSKRTKRSEKKMKLEVIDGRLKFAKPFAFNRLENVPVRYDMPDWVEEEDDKHRKKQPSRSKKAKKVKKERKSKLNQQISKKHSSATNIFSISREDNSIAGELELEDVDEDGDWVTVGDSGFLSRRDEDQRTVCGIVSLEEELNNSCVLTEEPENGEMEETSCSESTEAELREENSVLKEQLESFLTCQICFEAFDGEKHAKYSHACGHGCCLTCMKKEFARQRAVPTIKYSPAKEDRPDILLNSTIVYERDDDEKKINRVRKPLCTCIESDPSSLFDRLERIPDKYEIPDWVEEEDKKAREKKKMPKKGKSTNSAKQKNKQQMPLKPTPKKEIPAKNFIAKSQDKNFPTGELEFDNFDEGDWITVEKLKQPKIRCSNKRVKKSSKKSKKKEALRTPPVDKTEMRPSNVLKKSSNSETSTTPAQRLPSTAEEYQKILLDSSPTKNYLPKEKPESSAINANPCRSEPDQPLMKEISVLKEKLESFMMCQICYEAFDDEKHAKYSHACGHGCCLTCMKKEFARQREAKKKKFYCHCGFEIHEKKIIRMFI
ncbi:Oidioi.mRNA.OKI2018_I69.PAR.g10715.t1.cds [Oikopleura dioica]|uniref:Oidioi.mRNA.OKI2018_I69.PAR.g10715.t1.cds n=1 Tax=Oikopleura dioica TaxID=34765 RepID=A0ABN7RRY1_OIKDI|nr:Oidioi.mRNA.OKI2018_I69.PAR.g10715.t1.cds [Oikopleura dioica]